MLHDLTPEQKLLAGFMSEISEEAHSSGWQENLEYVLWDAVVNGERKYGRKIITNTDIKKLKQFSEYSGSWIYFDDNREEMAIDLSEWKKLFERAIIKNPSIVKR